jgi:hypothetical protein
MAGSNVVLSILKRDDNDPLANTERDLIRALDKVRTERRQRLLTTALYEDGARK